MKGKVVSNTLQTYADLSPSGVLVTEHMSGRSSCEMVELSALVTTELPRVFPTVMKSITEPVHTKSTLLKDAETQYMLKPTPSPLLLTMGFQLLRPSYGVPTDLACPAPSSWFPRVLRASFTKPPTVIGEGSSFFTQQVSAQDDSVDIDEVLRAWGRMFDA